MLDDTEDGVILIHFNHKCVLRIWEKLTSIETDFLNVFYNVQSQKKLFPLFISFNGDYG